jgi:hypothetical protein
MFIFSTCDVNVSLKYVVKPVLVSSFPIHTCTRF